MPLYQDLSVQDSFGHLVEMLRPDHTVNIVCIAHDDPQELLRHVGKIGRAHV